MSDPKDKQDSAVFGPDAGECGPHPDTDRRFYHLQTLYEASNALADPISPSDILRTFLQEAMGPLGLAFGFGVVLSADDLIAEGIGLDRFVVDQYRQGGFTLVHKFFPEEGDSPFKAEPVVMVGSHLRFDPNLPADTTALIAVSINQESQAVLGFGPKISGEPVDVEEAELLKGLAAILAATLKKTHAVKCVHDLNAALRNKNELMQQALAESERTKEALARHAFQVQALYDTTLELTETGDPEAMLDAFLLSLMGTLSFAGGWIGLYGPDAGQAEAAYRGPDPAARERLASPRGREAVLARFVALKDRMPLANHACLVEDRGARAVLPEKADAAVLFSLEHGWEGAIGLFDPLNPDAPALDEERQRLLLSLVGTFMVSLGNARQVRMVQDLNTELAARNVELQNTLDELTSAKHEINVQTEAKERIVGLVHGEVDRVQRASWRDIGLIILVSLVLSLLYNYSSPGGIRIIPQALTADPPAMIEPDEASRLAQTEKAVIIDARPGDFYVISHIPEAVNLPKDLFDFVYSMKLSELDPAVPLVVYGRTISRLYDEDVARELSLLGHERVLVIRGGLDAWEASGREVER